VFFFPQKYLNESGHLAFEQKGCFERTQIVSYGAILNTGLDGICNDANDPAAGKMTSIP
jgi:hypothetical protein